MTVLQFPDQNHQLLEEFLERLLEEGAILAAQHRLLEGFFRGLRYDVTPKGLERAHSAIYVVIDKIGAGGERTIFLDACREHLGDDLNKTVGLRSSASGILGFAGGQWLQIVAMMIIASAKDQQILLDLAA